MCTTMKLKNCTDMSDIKVTDVQKIIRGFADNGHDITQSPRHIHIDGKPYGMVVGHQLGFSSSQNWAHLHSYIMQTERPLVTQIFSVNDNTKKFDGATRRGLDQLPGIHTFLMTIQFHIDMLQGEANFPVWMTKTWDTMLKR